MVDTAGRVDRFRARSEAAAKLRKGKVDKGAAKAVKSDDVKVQDQEMNVIDAELEDKTVTTQNDIGSIPDESDTNVDAIVSEDTAKDKPESLRQAEARETTNEDTKDK